MKRLLLFIVTLALVIPVLLQPLALRADTADNALAPGIGEVPATTNTSVDDGDLIMLNTVWDRLMGVVERPAGLFWPPVLHVLSSEEMAGLKMDPKDPNAFATLYRGKPLVCVSPSILSSVIEGNSDRLAFVLGHELSHITLGHVRGKTAGNTALQFLVFSSDRELAADKQGMKVALAAGYNFKEAIGAGRRFIERGMDRPPLWPDSHPSWTKRLELLDNQRATLWQSMGAFSNGNFFLAVEQYASAEKCFAEVVKQFSDSYESWTNLGYARLMQYCDLLTTDDLRDFQIGHLMIGGFYTRPDSLIEKGKGKNTELWHQAVDALEAALRLKPDLTLAKADLGIAYLVRPEGKDLDKARQYLEEAATLADRDRVIGQARRAVVLINLGVAEMAAGKHSQSDQRFREAYGLAGDIPVVQAAIMYNHAESLLGSDNANQKGEAAKALYNYLQISSPASIWWKIGFEQYSRLCSEQRTTCATEQQIRERDAQATRRVVNVDLKGGKQVQVGDSVTDIEKRLGAARSIPVVRGANLNRLLYPKLGVDLICTDQVMAISVKGAAAPAITVQETGVGGRTKTLRVGMTQQQVAQVLGAKTYVAPAFSAKVPYRFYPNRGIAARYVGGRVAEYLVVVVPWREE